MAKLCETQRQMPSTAALFHRTGRETMSAHVAQEMETLMEMLSASFAQHALQVRGIYLPTFPETLAHGKQ